MADIELYMILAITGIFVVVIGAIILNQVRQARKKSTIDTAHASPSSFNSESKTKMMSRLDKRESMIRREQVLEGGILPELSELVIYSPVKNERISSAEVDVRGKTAIKSIVWINNQAAFVDVDGSFIGSVPVFKGKNVLDIIVIGPYGRTIATELPIICNAKNAPSQISEQDYLLPHISFEIRDDESSDDSSGYGQFLPETGIPSTKIATFDKSRDSIIVSESEIDPSILAALKGDPIMEGPLETAEQIPLDTIRPEISEDEIPDIPDVFGPEETQIPKVPDIDKIIDKKEKQKALIDAAAIEESIKVIEEVVKIDSKEKHPSSFEPDKMLPLEEKKVKKQVSEEEEEFELDEFQPLKQEHPSTQTLKVETRRQILDDERSTEILQHSGLIEKEDNELVPIIKVEKRIEKVGNKWYSTIGIANISEMEFTRLEIHEFISNTLELKDALPVNVQDPIIDVLPEGAKITWIINDVKPQMKIFITYLESLNPLQLIDEEKVTPDIIIRK